MRRRWRCRPGEQPTDFDKKIMYLENKGALVPTRELVLSDEQIEGIRRSGVVNTGVLHLYGVLPPAWGNACLPELRW